MSRYEAAIMTEVADKFQKYNPTLVPVQPKPVSSPKVVTATAPSQLGAAILAAHTAVGLSQTELAAKLKTAQVNIPGSKKPEASPQPTRCSASPRRPAIS